jgi:hypothetical protein
MQEEVKLTAQLAGPLRSLQDTARYIGEVSKECKVEVDIGTCMYLFSFLFFLPSTVLMLLRLSDGFSKYQGVVCFSRSHRCICPVVPANVDGFGARMEQRRKLWHYMQDVRHL